MPSEEFDSDVSDCDFINHTELGGRRTLRCLIFGCKHLSKRVMRFAIHGWCEFHSTEYYRIDDGTMFGRDVHVGCCVRCQTPITPRARALKGSP